MSTSLNQKQSYPHYHFGSNDWETLLEGRFWNCKGNHIAIIAAITKKVDWAAYIGTDAPNSYKEDDTLKYVSQRGCKLAEKDARYFFPEIDLPYRE